MNKNHHPPAIQSYFLEPRTGMALEVFQGQTLRIIDVKGQQVVDLVSYSSEKPQEYLSAPRSMDLNNRIFFSRSDLLYSNLSEPMWEITADRVGKHCFLFAPCDQRMFEITYKVEVPHPNCFENLSAGLRPFGISPDKIFVPFNIFMHAEVSKSGEIKIHPPLSKAGDYIDLRARMDMIVAVSACSAYRSNNYTFGPIRMELY